MYMLKFRTHFPNKQKEQKNRYAIIFSLVVVYGLIYNNHMVITVKRLLKASLYYQSDRLNLHM